MNSSDLLETVGLTIHIQICEDSWEDCKLYGGRCVNAYHAAVNSLVKEVSARAWDEGAATGATYGVDAIALNPLHANPYREVNHGD